MGYHAKKVFDQAKIYFYPFLYLLNKKNCRRTMHVGDITAEFLIKKYRRRKILVQDSKTHAAKPSLKNQDASNIIVEQ